VTFGEYKIEEKCMSYFKKTDIMLVSNLAWLRCGGQAIRMSYSEMPKQIMNYRSQGKRRVEISEAS